MVVLLGAIAMTVIEIEIVEIVNGTGPETDVTETETETEGTEKGIETKAGSGIEVDTAIADQDLTAGHIA